MQSGTQRMRNERMAQSVSAAAVPIIMSCAALCSPLCSPTEAWSPRTGWRSSAPYLARAQNTSCNGAEE